MKKLITVLIALFSCVNLMHAQTSKIGLVAYKQVDRVNGKWQNWPSDWNNYADEGRDGPEIQVTIFNSDPYIYNLVYYVDGTEKANFEVIYDADKTAAIRKEWKTQYVNCYADEEGNYIYVQGTSLDHLAKDPSAWGSDPNTKLYMWVTSGNFAVIVK